MQATIPVSLVMVEPLASRKVVRREACQQVVAGLHLQLAASETSYAPVEVVQQVQGQPRAVVVADQEALRPEIALQTQAAGRRCILVVVAAVVEGQARLV